jgi:hypothetical protein
MASGQFFSVILAAFFMGAAWGQGVDSGARTGEFVGKVVIAGSGTQVETAIDIIANALEKGGVPVKVVPGETSRRAENEKLPTNGAVSLLYVNSDIARRSSWSAGTRRAHRSGKSKHPLRFQAVRRRRRSGWWNAS